MKKVKIVQADGASLEPVKLKDFSSFEEKMTKIKHFKAVRDELDKSFLLSAIEELEMKGKKITAKKVKKVLKKALAEMIEEVKE